MMLSLFVNNLLTNASKTADVRDENKLSHYGKTNGAIYTTLSFFTARMPIYYLALAFSGLLLNVMPVLWFEALNK